LSGPTRRGLGKGVDPPVPKDSSITTVNRGANVAERLGHYFGYRSYGCQDASGNIVPWGILIGGEELHNNITRS
jgi:hypothetical protein